MKNKIWVVLIILVIVFASGCQADFSLTETAPELEYPTSTNLPEVTALPTATSLPTNTPSPTPTVRLSPTPWFTPTSGPTPVGGSEWVVFSLSERKAEQYIGLGIYAFNFSQENLTQLFGEGYVLQDISPDGKWLLVNQGNDLYLSGLFEDNVLLLSDRFEANTGQTASWTLDGETLMWLEREQAQTQVNLVVTDALAFEPAQRVDLPHTPLMLSPSPSKEQVIWRAGACSDQTNCSAGVWVSDLTTQQSLHLEDLTYPEVNQNGDLLGLVQEAETSLLTLTNFDRSQETVLALDEDYPADYAFSPLTQTAAVLAQVRSDYSGKNFGNRVLTFSEPLWKPLEIGELDGLNAVLAWSPDGKQLAMMSTMIGDSGYTIDLSRLTPQTKQQESFSEQLNLNAEDYIFVTKMGWVP